ncbi:MAG: sulfite exporter TauE/SafE family protein [Acidobacteria bacterium]|nr:sulfite exporter TauE/SafE family protein [Acidobacteriota bacterium]MBI3424721.1 sulfite exporter TauE/SafE family protein [Acidobacteriota bacterium]
MSLTEFNLIFTLGLVSSLHCAQMCGPIVLALSLPLSTAQRQQHLLAHLSYNIGRLVTYSMLGALAGLTGQTLGIAGKLAGIENTGAILAGGLMVLTGLLMLDILPTRPLQRFDPLRLLMRVFKPIGSRLASTSISSKFTLGMLLGFLPCGLIYAALFKAMATGTVLAGSLTMLAFGLGTAGALLAIGMLSSAFSVKLSASLSTWGVKTAALSITLLGVFLVWRGVTSQVSASQRSMLPTANASRATPPHCH